MQEIPLEPQQSTFVLLSNENDAKVEESQENSTEKLEKLKLFCITHWFLIGLVIVIILAAIWPIAGSKKGPLATSYSIGFGVTSAIFLMSGLNMKTAVLTRAFIHWRLIFLVQVFSFGVTSAIAFGIAKLLSLANFDSNLVAGIIVACCTPTTIASNVLMTKQANGNEAAALVNAVLGNVVGIFISPLLIFAYLGMNSSGNTNFSGVFLKLGVSVLVPLIVGQIIRFLFPKAVEWLQKRVNFSILNSTMLLLIVWTVFCDSFLENVFTTIPAWQTVVIFILDLFLFTFFSGLAFYLARFFKFTKADTVAIVMCGATKTVALGIPIINVIFAGNPGIGVLSIPLLIYHAEQLVVGAIFVTMFLKWNQQVCEEI